MNGAQNLTEPVATQAETSTPSGNGGNTWRCLRIRPVQYTRGVNAGTMRFLRTGVYGCERLPRLASWGSLVRAQYRPPQESPGNTGLSFTKA